MKKTFTVPGEPVGKGRPRAARTGNGVRLYTPARTEEFENTVGYEYIAQCGREKFPEDTPIAVEIRAYFAIPRSANRQRHADMEAGKIRPMKKPDTDNVIKSVCDGLNNVAWKDDSGIISCSAEKFYSDDPRTEITIYTI